MLIVLAVWLSECAWLYLVVRAAAGASNQGLAFTPVLLAPYGTALIFALLLSPLYRRGAASPAGSSVSDVAGESGHRNNQHGKDRPPGIAVALTLVAMTANLLGAAASIAAVIWWELYRDRSLLDPSWLLMAREDAARSSATLPPILWPIVLGIFLWWRGARLAREENVFTGLVSRFLWGTVALLALATTGWLSALDAVMSTMTVGIYLLAGMAAMAAARLEMAQTDRAGTVDRSWRGSSTAIALLLVIVGVGLAITLAPRMEEAARWIRDWFFGFLLPLLLEILRWIAHLLGLDTPPKPHAVPPPDTGAQAKEPGIPFTLPESFRNVMRAIFNLSWAIIILLAVYRWVESWTWGRRPRPTNGYRRERLPWSPLRSLKGFLLRLLESLLAWFPALSVWARHLAAPAGRASTVRDVYRRLLAWGASRGEARVSWVTPREYLELLTARWPALEDEFHAITESYVRARYGAANVPDAELQHVMAAWARIAARRHAP